MEVVSKEKVCDIIEDCGLDACRTSDGVDKVNGYTCDCDGDRELMLQVSGSTCVARNVTNFPLQRVQTSGVRCDTMLAESSEIQHQLQFRAAASLLFFSPLSLFFLPSLALFFSPLTVFVSSHFFHLSIPFFSPCSFFFSLCLSFFSILSLSLSHFSPLSFLQTLVALSSGEAECYALI